LSEVKMSQHDLGLVNFSPEPHSVELREIPRATIGDDQVLMEVQAIGVWSAYEIIRNVVIRRHRRGRHGATRLCQRA
jgi:hypothetical protein